MNSWEWREHNKLKRISYAKEISTYLNNLWDKTYKESKGDMDDEVWAKLYDTVFSDKISKKIHRVYPGFTWCDPDTSYQEDVTAYIRDFEEYANGLEEN